MDESDSFTQPGVVYLAFLVVCSFVYIPFGFTSYAVSCNDAPRHQCHDARGESCHMNYNESYFLLPLKVPVRIFKTRVFFTFNYTSDYPTHLLFWIYTGYSSKLLILLAAVRTGKGNRSLWAHCLKDGRGGPGPCGHGPVCGAYPAYPSQPPLLWVKDLDIKKLSVLQSMCYTRAH